MAEEDDTLPDENTLVNDDANGSPDAEYAPTEAPPEAPPEELPAPPTDNESVVDKPAMQEKDAFSAALDVGDSIYQYVRKMFSGEGGKQQTEGQPESKGALNYKPGDMDEYTPDKYLRKGFDKLRELVAGAGAADPKNIKAVEQAVMQTGQGGTPTAVKAMTLAHAVSVDPEYGMGFEQGYRKEYDLAKNHAAVALNGTPTKQADFRAAVADMNMAMPNIAGPEHVSFAMGENGAIVATVADAKTGRPVSQTTLTPQQFNQLLRGPEGVYDMMKENGASAALAKLAQSPGMPLSVIRPQQQARGAQPLKGFAPPPGVRSQPPQGMPTGRQEQVNPIWTDPMFDDPVYKQSSAMFPAASQSDERNKWYTAQKQLAEKNDIDRKKADHDWRLQLQTQRDSAKTQQLLLKLQADLDRNRETNNTKLTNTRLQQEGAAYREGGRDQLRGFQTEGAEKGVKGYRKNVPPPQMGEAPTRGSTSTAPQTQRKKYKGVWYIPGPGGPNDEPIPDPNQND